MSHQFNVMTAMVISSSSFFSKNSTNPISFANNYSLLRCISNNYMPYVLTEINNLVCVIIMSQNDSICMHNKVTTYKSNTPHYLISLC